MKSQKVAIFLQDLTGGGAERVMLQLAGGMVEESINVDLVLVRAVGPYLSEIPPQVRTIVLGKRRTPGSIPSLARYLRNELPSVLLSALVHVNIAAVLAARLSRTRTRVVVIEQNQISRVASTASTLEKMAHRLAPWIYPLADGIVAVSQGVADDLTEFAGIPAERITVIFNPVVTPGLSTLASEPVQHPWFGLTNQPIILGVGRLHPQKDFPTLLRAFAEVRRHRPAKLVIIGEGPIRAELIRVVDELHLQDDVDLPGFVRNPYAWMAKADALVLSSAWEGLPTVLIEAMACGTAVVATDCLSGPREILDDGRYGPLVPVGDAKALSNAILMVLDRPPAAEFLRLRASHFTVERSVREYLQVLFRDTFQ